MRKSPRDRRLSSDFRSVQELQRQSSIFSFEATGNPPQKYRVSFNGKGVRRNPNGEIKIANQHEVLIELGAAYPRMIPFLAWQTPIFHPNISNNGVVCLGGYGTHWVPSLTLSELCTMLWEMIRYANFDSQSPYNREAALWAQSQTDVVFPLDKRSIRNRFSESAGKSAGSNSAPEIMETGIEIIEPEIVQSEIEIIEIIEPASPFNDNGILFLD